MDQLFGIIHEDGKRIYSQDDYRKLQADNKRLKEGLSNIEELTNLIDTPDEIAKAIFREIEKALTDKE